jgi:O-antigen/teichoic acid export membrane protein
MLIKGSKKFLSLGAVRAHTLRTNFLWTAAGNGIFSLSQWGILVVFAKLGSTTLVGQLVNALALMTPIFVVAGLQLRSIQATDANNRYTIGQYLGLRATTTTVAVIAGMIVSAIVWVAGGDSYLIILFWTLSKAADTSSDALYALFQQAERMDYMGLSLILRAIAATASVTILFRATHSGPIALAGLAASWSAVFVLYDIPVARIVLRQRKQSSIAADSPAESLRPLFGQRELWRLFSEAAPLGIVGFLLAVQMQVPRYIVAGLLHTRELGLFSAAAYLTLIGTMLVNALGAPACVRLAKYHVLGAGAAFRRLLAKLLAVATALGVAGILISIIAGGRILTLMYTTEYSRMAGVLTMLCAGSAVSYVGSFLGYSMTALRRYRIQVPLFLAVLLTTLLSCYWLTVRYGMMGTAAGILVGNLAQLLMSAVVVVGTLRRSSANLPVDRSPVPLETKEVVA